MFKLINKYGADVYIKERLHFEGWKDEYQNYTKSCGGSHAGSVYFRKLVSQVQLL